MSLASNLLKMLKSTDETFDERSIESVPAFEKFMRDVVKVKVTVEPSSAAPDVFHFSIPDDANYNKTIVALADGLSKLGYKPGSDNFTARYVEDCRKASKSKEPVSLGFATIRFEKIVRVAGKKKWEVDVVLKSENKKVKGLFNISLFS